MYLIDTCAEHVSTLTFGELEKGIAKLATTRRRAALEKWFGALRERFQGRVLAVDDVVALEWGRISARVEREGRPVPVVDALIAATAIVHGLAVVTRNTSDIARTGAPIVDPWEA